MTPRTDELRRLLADHAGALEWSDMIPLPELLDVADAAADWAADDDAGCECSLCMSLRRLGSWRRGGAIAALSGEHSDD